MDHQLTFDTLSVAYLIPNNCIGSLVHELQIVYNGRRLTEVRAG